jgi:Fic family protein
MIVSMKPPYKITPTILKLISSISEKLGEVKANYLNKPSIHLRQQNRIRTIHSSLSIEGNTLTIEQITAIIENKRVIGPKDDILEVQNAIKVYEDLKKFNPLSQKSFLAAHKLFMKGLVENPGKFRSRNVGILQGTDIGHLAPPPENVPAQMNDLFKYLKSANELTLIKSCVFHYEMEFIHPFSDGNGRMGRLWQTILLMHEYPVFEYLPFETLINQTRDDYYRALSQSDKSGESTVFIEYMLNVIENSLEEILNFKNRTMTEKDRLEYFLTLNGPVFSRKDYMNVFKDISSATASRDLKCGVDHNLFEKSGMKNKTIYRKP